MNILEFAPLQLDKFKLFTTKCNVNLIRFCSNFGCEEMNAMIAIVSRGSISVT